MSTLYDSVYTQAVEIPVTAEELTDLQDWAEEHQEPLADLMRRVVLDAVAS